VGSGLQLHRSVSVNSSPSFYSVMGLARFYFLLRAELQTAQGLGEQGLTLAKRMYNSALLLEAHRSLVAALFWLGELVLARTQLSTPLSSMTLTNIPPILHTVQDLQVSCLSFSELLFFAGFISNYWGMRNCVPCWRVARLWCRRLGGLRQQAGRLHHTSFTKSVRLTKKLSCTPSHIPV
jgi:hypothetical protein